MPRLVTKFKYLKPNARLSTGGYAKYIATREGAERIDESQQHLPATKKQQALIKRLLKNFPDSKASLEYADYLQTKTVGSASEFISRMIEEHADQAVGVKTYADYIATRPRAEHFGSHALFTDDGVPVQLSKVSEELNQHQGNIWTAIVSMRREDAVRLGYDHGERWRDMLRTQTQTISEAFRIPMQNLKWFAAFHNESHHPHVHMIIYSDVPSEGFLSKAGVQKLRSSFARDVFAEDLTNVYSQQTEHRDEFRAKSRELIAEIVSDINRNVYDNPKVEELLLQLAIRLCKTSGKKVYGFLKPDVKALVDSIVDELSADPRIIKLYDLWYQQRAEVLRTYTDEMPKRVPLSQNKEFKPIKNAVIQEAMNLVLGQIPDDDSIEPEDSAATELEDPPPDATWMNPEDPEDAVPWLEIASTQGDAWAQYKLGKMLLCGEHVDRDADRAVELLESSYRQGNSYAAYLLGKAYLGGILLQQDIPVAEEMLAFSAESGLAEAQYVYGKLLYQGEETPQDLPAALHYLEAAAAQGNSFAACLAAKIYLTEVSHRSVPDAIRLLEQAAEHRNSYAEYELGKLYLYGREVQQDESMARYWFRSSAEHGNMQAAQLLHSCRPGKIWPCAMGSLRLLLQLARLFDDEQEQQSNLNRLTIDRKMRRKIEEKMQAHGLKQG